ncbi:amidase [Ochrobactrum pecoris]|uniref:Amidase n=1 Tax=Brucella pecoris TaxID=867683 RepID=A0A5C5CUS3_9HYPH|nr:amidase [Brucella pecoris]MBB4093036.1 aspartyl-tRNA(Asn)/glutamyl-tRNA(Gln) amidotransferase subunit A [Brucella pecoris]NKW80814.1 amidase [Brucella pecoris]TNV14825.1 amidase [Brucella pecoris]
MNSVRDRLESILSRLEARARSERVFSKVYAQQARAEADAADARLRDRRALGPLDGRIVSIKDLFDVAGEPTLAGSVVRRAAAPATRDAAIVRRLRDAGAVIVGKTHMTEFAFTPVGLNPHYGEPGNAIDPTRVAGGSSSGAAVSAAEGTSEIAIGSDTGGSVRIPAALNGIVGFKPTARRIPLDGVFPLAPSLDSIGPLTRTVADAIITDAVMAGETPVLPDALPLKGLRVALPKGYLLADMEPDVAKHFEASVALLEKAGAIIADLEVDDLIQRLREVTRVGSIAGIEASHVHASTWLGDPDANVDIRVKRPLSVRIKVPMETYRGIMETRATLVREMDERLSGFDMFVTPTTPIVAPTIASVSNDEAEYDRVEGLLLRDTQVGNQFDLCSISIPMPGMTLPTGFMLSARGGTDNRLLAAALSVEKLLG